MLFHFKWKIAPNPLFFFLFRFSVIETPHGVIIVIIIAQTQYLYNYLQVIYLCIVFRSDVVPFPCKWFTLYNLSYMQTILINVSKCVAFCRMPNTKERRKKMQTRRLWYHTFSAMLLILCVRFVCCECVSAHQMPTEIPYARSIGIYNICIKDHGDDDDGGDDDDNDVDDNGDDGRNDEKWKKTLPFIGSNELNECSKMDCIMCMGVCACCLGTWHPI